jgi:ribosomal protein S18 acetylase RimI-like enzyme
MTEDGDSGTEKNAQLAESVDITPHIETLNTHNSQVASEILREYMLVTENEYRETVNQVTELPAILERECDEIADVYQQPNGFFLAFEGEELAGCVGVKLRGENAEVARLYVRPLYRGRHIAVRLMELAETHAKAVGAKQLVLDVLPSRYQVIAWYERVGFTEIPPYEQLPMPMVFLGKPL